MTLRNTVSRVVHRMQTNTWIATVIVLAIFATALLIVNNTVTLQSTSTDAAFIRNTGTTTGGNNNTGTSSGCTYESMRTPTAHIKTITAKTITIRAVNNDPATCGKSRFSFDYAFNNRASDGSYVLDKNGKRVGKTAYTAPDGTYAVDPLFTTSNGPSSYVVAPGGYIEITYTLTDIFPLNKDLGSAIFFDAIHDKPDICYSTATSSNSLCSQSYGIDNTRFVGNTTAALSKSGTLSGQAVSSGSLGGSNTATGGTWGSGSTASANLCQASLIHSAAQSMSATPCPLPTTNHTFTINWQVDDSKVSHYPAGDTRAGKQACSVRGSGITGTAGYEHSIRVTLPSYQKYANYTLSCDIVADEIGKEYEFAKICVGESGQPCGTTIDIDGSGVQINPNGLNPVNNHPQTIINAGDPLPTPTKPTNTTTSNQELKRSLLQQIISGQILNLRGSYFTQKSSSLR